VSSASRERQRLRLGLVAAGALSLAVVCVLGAWARDGRTFGWDARLHASLTGYEDPVASEHTGRESVITFLDVADVLSLVALLTAAGVLVVRRSFRNACFLAGSLAAAVALTYVLKAVFDRPPLDPYGKYELPSGHATRSLVVVGALAALTWGTRLWWPFVAAGALFVATVGASLVYEDWHTPSDVVGGWALAVGVLAVGTALLLGPFGRSVRSGDDATLRETNDLGANSG
jgi:membrane-associated phospholipid phosphatase